MMDIFDYHEAFKRNLGYLTPEDQQQLRQVRIALPGLGGVGGHHLHSFLRLGVENFHLADLDNFELANFNRQHEANMGNLGKSKVEVMKRFALSINPNCQIKTFPSGVNLTNMNAFLSQIDLVVDTLDLYEMPLKVQLFQKAHDHAIPVITAAPLGMGTALLAFDPYGMSFNEYFDLDSRMSIHEMITKFIVGIAPKFTFLKSLVYRQSVNIAGQQLPSLDLGCSAATSALGAQALKILLKRPKVMWAPQGFQIDFYSWQASPFCHPKGNKSLTQKIRFELVKQTYKKLINSGNKTHSEPRKLFNQDNEDKKDEFKAHG